MPVRNEESLNNQQKRIDFEETPIMSSYLVAFSMGELEYVEDTTSIPGLAIRVYTVPGKKLQGLFSLQLTSKCLLFYAEYFGNAYALPKLDLIAIPDFAAGAMENWGLITFREQLLLIDPSTTSISSKQYVAEVVAHEIAHQWFGNLVTMEWWKELWLNEGFASWVGNLAVDHLFPEWNMWLHFGAKYFSQAQQLDAMLSSHPIEVDVYSGDAIMEIFDAISYFKGASMIRMIENFIGKEKFQKGMHIYLNTHLYGNANTQDLWSALTASSGKDIAAMMKEWTSQAGYPVLEIDHTSGGNIVMTQRRFLASPSPVEDSKQTEQDTSVHWHIPVSIRYPNGSLAVAFTEKKQTISELPLDSWIFANEGQAGFYRVLYKSVDLREALKRNIHQLEPIERLGLQNDWFALSFANEMDIVDALDIASVYHDEEQYAVWSDLSANLAKLLSLWEGEETFLKLVDYCKNIYMASMDHIGWEEEETDELRTLHRSLLKKALGAMGEEKILAWCKDLFKTPSGIHPDQQALVFETIIRHGSKEDFYTLLELYHNTESHEGKNRILSALALTTEEDLLLQILDFSVSEHVRSQDCFKAFVSTSKSEKGRQIAWKYLKEHWATFVNKFGEGQFLFPRIISYATAHFQTMEMADDIQSFFEEHPVTFERTLAQSLEGIANKVYFLQMQQASLRSFFA